MDTFWSKVDKSGECWLWTGYCNAKGYGKTYHVEHGHMTTHRLAYTLTHGAIPDGAHVLHSCDNPPCVNPAHLRIGTHADNMRDRLMRGRYARKDECVAGHQLNDTNTYVTPDGRRQCRTCLIRRKREYRARQKKAA